MTLAEDRVQAPLWDELLRPDGRPHPAGWVDLDPTNGLVQPDRHVTIGWGRDYTDVVPVRGVVFGPPGEQELSVSLDVAPVHVTHPDKAGAT